MAKIQRYGYMIIRKVKRLPRVYPKFCLYCNKLYYAKKRNQYFCSFICRHTFTLHYKKIRRNSPRSIKTFQLIVCEFCHKPALVPPRKNRKFGSRKCCQKASAYKRMVQSKPNLTYYFTICWGCTRPVLTTKKENYCPSCQKIIEKLQRISHHYIKNPTHKESSTWKDVAIIRTSLSKKAFWQYNECAWCGTPIEKNKYCSKKCRKKMTNARRRALRKKNRIIEKKKIPLIIKERYNSTDKCLICGERLEPFRDNYCKTCVLKGIDDLLSIPI